MTTHSYAESPRGSFYLDRGLLERFLYRGKHHRGRRGKFNILPLSAWGMYSFVKSK
jgi:hypothetical protein